MANTERLQAVLEHIRQHPEQHDQATWGFRDACQTSTCFAGHAILMYAPERARWEGGILGVTGLERLDTLAGQILDLTDQQCRSLFFDAITVDELELMVGHLNEHPHAARVELGQAADIIYPQ